MCLRARTILCWGSEAIAKCKHKNKLDVTRSAKRRRRQRLKRRREIESFKNEHRKIYLGEKPMGNTHTYRNTKTVYGKNSARCTQNRKTQMIWIDSVLFALKRARTPSLHTQTYTFFTFVPVQLSTSQPKKMSFFLFFVFVFVFLFDWHFALRTKTIWIYLFYHSFWYILLFFYGRCPMCSRSLSFYLSLHFSTWSW